MSISLQQRIGETLFLFFNKLIANLLLKFKLPVRIIGKFSVETLTSMVFYLISVAGSDAISITAVDHVPPRNIAPQGA